MFIHYVQQLYGPRSLTPREEHIPPQGSVTTVPSTSVLESQVQLSWSLINNKY